ncbi:hypothetical protein [Pantanalinema sp. GBBB05]|uniref:hypothetical protein n=1 Tax=Pantanalinema sp. GBBB05 TaxID=2604139 RepID=UPI001D303789|nr:DUF1574 domain-containing protein [Pantanalinema sp. GBBB05]
MANVDGHNSSPSGGSFSVETATKRVSLTHWIHRVIGLSQAQIKMRLRGNVLHLLCEGQPCPDAEAIVWRLQRAFAIAPLEKLLPAGSPQIFQMTIYGRELGEANPAWTRTIHFHCSSLAVELIDSSSENTVTPPPAISAAVTESTTGETRAEGTSATIVPESITSEAIAPISAEPVVSESAMAESSASAASVPESASLEEAVVPSPALQESQVDIESDREAAAIVHIADLARQGQPDALAWYLSEVLSHLDVAVRVKIEVGKPASEDAGEPNSQATESTSPIEPPKRLLILCESIYAPDPGRLAEPIAQRLRELELSGFQHAIVFGQVQGEIRPEWLLRVDLTPPEITLREWARWGDVQAISQLLNQNLRSQEIQVSALLKDSTLHLSCSGMGVTAPDKLTTLGTIAPLLQELAPQGIHAATIYGLIRDPANTVATAEDDVVSPLWVHWLDLPATTQPDRALSTLELTQQGNLEAITFLLTRLLNPDLATKLATGGIRVQIRQKGDLLHVMTDAPNCPRQSDVGTAVVRFLKPLAISDVVGVRVYGRRAGQKQPLWSYGADFAPRSRLVPEATPEFAASDAYVNELLSSPGAIVLWSELPPNDWRSVIQAACGTAVGWLQRSLIASQLFVPWESVTLNASTTEANLGSETGSATRSAYGVGVALIWSAVGVLLVLQSDWLLGGWVQPLLTEQLTPIAQQPAAPAPTSSPAPLPNLPLQKSQPAASEDFNESGFTRPGSVVVSPQNPTETGQSAAAEVALLASPLQPTAESVSAIAMSTYPTFNSRQFDTQLALYRRFLEQHGTPDVLVIGSSRALRGIDPVALQTALAEQGYPGVKVFNFGVNGATVQVVDLLVRQILPPERLPKLILWADGARAFNSGRIDITYNGIVASEGYRTLLAGQPPIPGTTVAQAAGTGTKPQADPDKAGTEEVTASLSGSYRVLNDWLNQRLAALSVTYGQRDRLKNRLREQVSAWLPQSGTLAASMRLISPNSLADSTSPAASASTSVPPVLAESQSQIDVNGFLPLAVRFNPATYYQKYPRVPGDYDSDYESFQLNGKQTDALIALAQFAQVQHIPLVFVNLPLTAEYLDPPRQRHEAEFQRHLLQLAPQLGLIYRDLSQSLGNRSEYFSDPSHLNRYGGYEVSRRLAQDVMIPWSQAR